MTKLKQERILPGVKTTLHILVLFCAAMACAADNEGFGRYQLIIDKRPFGEEPLEAEVVQISLNESFAKSLRLSMLFEGSPGDVRVGIIDKSNDKNYTFRVGETINDILLIEANIDESTALLQKGNEVAEFTLKADDKPKVVPKKDVTTRKTAYQQRREALLKNIQSKQDQEKPALTGEDLRKHLEEVQMDAIRTGKPPLPLALTPEMDAQLVAEGVLDPQ